MVASNGLTGSQDAASGANEAEIYKSAVDEQAGIWRIRLAFGLLVAGAVSCIRDIMVATDSSAGPKDTSIAEAAATHSAPNVVDDNVLPPADDTSPPRSHESEPPQRTKPSLTTGDGGLSAIIPPTLAPDAGNDNGFFPEVVRAPNVNTPRPETTVHDRSAVTGHQGAEATPADPVRQSETAADEEEVDDTPDQDRALRNRSPVVSGPVVLDGLLVNQSVIIGLSSLLQHASDPDGDALTVANLTASSGHLQANGDGTWIFKPDTDDTSEVVFSYTIRDGFTGVEQTAKMDLLPKGLEVLTGTDGDDILIGTAGNDYIDGKAGNDIIVGLAGDDVLSGGSGADRLLGGAGDDTIFGGAGDDVIFGGAGNDRIFADSGDDIVFGEAGDDVIYAGIGDDQVFGGSGDDVIFGEAGSDLLSGDSGADTIDGGAGEDVIVATIDDGNDRYDGGAGSDLYDLSATAAAATVDLEAGTSTSSETGHDMIANIENVIGGTGGDTITGDDKSNTVSGNDGDDVLAGGAGDDLVSGDNGDDVILATIDDGSDRYDGGAGVDTYDLSATAAAATVDLEQGTSTSSETGHDTIANVENVIGGAGGDTITGDDSANDIDGGGGEDVIEGGAGNDHLHGGDGADELWGGWFRPDEALLDRPVNAPPIADGTSETVVRVLATLQDGGSAAGLADDDVVIGSSRTDRLKGRDGNDVMVGDGGNDRLYGGDDDDTFIATLNDGNDLYRGDSGVDTYDLSLTNAGAVVDLDAGTSTSSETGFDSLRDIENVVGGSGDDTIIANDEVNKFTGGNGDDTFVFKSARDIGNGAGSRDVITDFRTGDKIDLSELDANTQDDGHQSFELLAPLDAEGVVGKISYHVEFFDGEAHTIIVGRTGENENDRFEIDVLGIHEFSVTDFSGVH